MKQITTLILIAIAMTLGANVSNAPGTIAKDTTWQADTMYIARDITLEPFINLTIEAGTTVMFTGPYSFFVNGNMMVYGTDQDSVRFTSQAPNGWGGLRFRQATGDFSHCVFEKGNGFNHDEDYYGGAIHAREQSQLSFERCRFYDNFASCGGAVAVLNSEATFASCLFDENIGDLEGGGLYAERSYIEVSRTDFTGNRAIYGAACVVNRSDETQIFERCDFIGNVASSSGGGMLGIDAFLRFDNCDFHNNQSGMDGGGLHIDYCNSDIVECNFSNNFADAGGALSAFGGDFLIESCVFTENTADDGGACYIGNTVYIPYIVNSLFENNTGEFGGAFYALSLNYPYFYNCTITANHAEQAGAFYSVKAFSRFYNCIIWGNDSQDDLQYYQEHPSYGFPTFLYCLIENGQGSIGGPALDSGSYSYINNIEADPLFTMEENFPYTLQDGSACIDAGTPNTSNIPVTFYDLAGNERIENGRIDIGCYEYHYMDQEQYHVDDNISTMLLAMQNPYSIGGAINLSVPEAGKVEVEIFNVKGQKVRTLLNDSVPADQNISLVWMGVDSHNRQVASGVYFCRMHCGGKSSVQKLLLLR